MSKLYKLDFVDLLQLLVLLNSVTTDDFSDLLWRNSTSGNMCPPSFKILICTIATFLFYDHVHKIYFYFNSCPKKMYDQWYLWYQLWYLQDFSCRWHYCEHAYRCWDGIVAKCCWPPHYHDLCQDHILSGCFPSTARLSLENG